jgi:ABC-2 type transport system permease protein
MKVSRTSTPKVGVLKTDTLPPANPYAQPEENSERTADKFKQIFEALKETYDVSTVDLKGGQAIDTSIKTLIIPGGLDGSYSLHDLYAIDQYFMKGGNLIVLADAMRVNFSMYGVNAVPQDPQILKLLEHYGVRIEKKLICDASCGQVQVPQNFGGFQMNALMEYPYFVRIAAAGINTGNPAVSGVNDIIFPWISPLTLIANGADSASAGKNVKVKSTVLLSSSPKSWLESDNLMLNPQQEWGRIFKEKQGSLGVHPVVVHLNGDFNSYFADKPVPQLTESNVGDTLNKIKMQPDAGASDQNVVKSSKNRNLVVFGSSNFISGNNRSPSNTALFVNLVDWLTLNENLISIRSRALTDRSINTDRLKSSSALPMIIRIINILGMPLLVILVGLFIFFKRRGSVVETVKSTEEKAS